MDKCGWEARMRQRMRHLCALLFICVFIIVMRQMYLQLFSGDIYSGRAAQQRHKTVRLSVRGDIVDRNGEPLATSSYRDSIGIRPWQVLDRRFTADVLGNLLDIDSKQVFSDLESYDCFFYLKRPASDQECQAIRDWREDQINRMKSVDPNYDEDPLPGVDVGVDKSCQRFYPQGALAAHLLGFVGLDGVGLEGIEARYDSELAGNEVVREEQIDVGNVPVGARSETAAEAVDGKNVQLTIDTRVQYITERALEKAVKERHAKGGVCLVMDVPTGEILASAVCPDFSPADYGKSDKNSLRNRAIADVYEPGSVFKVFTAAAVLKDGFTPNSCFECTAYKTIDGCTIGNSHGEGAPGGVATMEDIIAYSENTGTATMALSIGKEKLAKTFEKFGFGRATGVGLQGETDGYIGDYRDWSSIDTAVYSYGQGLMVTPIQLVSAMQAIANGGVRMRPRVVKAILSKEGKVLETFPAQAMAQVVSAENSRDLIAMMEQVVERGTGKMAAVPGYVVAGKTGTADVPDPVRGGYDPQRHNSSFLGIAPADAPRLVILVKLEDCQPVYYGGAVAGPVFREICSQVLPYLGIPPREGFNQVMVSAGETVAD